MDASMLSPVEVLNGCILLNEHTGSRWAPEWFGKISDLIRKKLDLVANGYNIWEYKR